MCFYIIFDCKLNEKEFFCGNWNNWEKRIYIWASTKNIVKFWGSSLPSFLSLSSKYGKISCANTLFQPSSSSSLVPTAFENGMKWKLHYSLFLLEEILFFTGGRRRNCFQSQHSNSPNHSPLSGFFLEISLLKKLHRHNFNQAFTLKIFGFKKGHENSFGRQTSPWVYK